MKEFDYLKYLNIYYKNKIPNNICVFFLEEENYKQKYKEITKKINKRTDNDFVNTAGYYLYDSKENFHYVLIKKYGQVNHENFYILNLFHELSHIETFPYKTGLKIEKYSKTKQSIVEGYNFWIEYIAEYEMINRYQMYIENICYLEEKNLFEKRLKSLNNNLYQNLYEIILMLEIQPHFINIIKKEYIELIALLKEIKYQLYLSENIKEISISQLQKIGNIIVKIKKLEDL